MQKKKRKIRQTFIIWKGKGEGVGRGGNQISIFHLPPPLRQDLCQAHREALRPLEHANVIFYPDNTLFFFIR